MVKLNRNNLRLSKIYFSREKHVAKSMGDKAPAPNRNERSSHLAEQVIHAGACDVRGPRLKKTRSGRSSEAASRFSAAVPYGLRSAGKISPAPRLCEA